MDVDFGRVGRERSWRGPEANSPGPVVMVFDGLRRFLGIEEVVPPCDGPTFEECEEVGLGRGRELGLVAVPWQPKPMGVQGMAGKHQAGALAVCQAPLNEGEVGPWIMAVQLVAHQRMAKVGKVDAHLVGPARFEPCVDEGERKPITLESSLHAPASPSG